MRLFILIMILFILNFSTSVASGTWDGDDKQLHGAAVGSMIGVGIVYIDSTVFLSRTWRW